MQRKNYKISSVLLVLLTTLLTPIFFSNGVAAQKSDLNRVYIAVYNDRGVETSQDSFIALKNMFIWMGATVDYLNADKIRRGELKNYDLLCMPGGFALYYESELGTDGMNNINQFVENGGSYFGICGGSQFATESALGLFNGSYMSPLPGLGLDTFLINVTINRNSTGPDLSKEPIQYATLYWGSGYFQGEDMSNIISIASYPAYNKSGMIAFTCGNGKVFLSSPHPEFEEGNDRDGTESFDYLNDPDSEWNLLLKVSRWLVGAPRNYIFSNIFLNIGICGASFIGIALIIYLNRRKLKA
jgi:glutamine amidotransferase-like uncharacterized protein